MKYASQSGDVHKVDNAGNHFLNGKCQNPKSYEGAEIGDSFDGADLELVDEKDSLTITGHVPVFTFYDHDLKEEVTVDTGGRPS